MFFMDTSQKLSVYLLVHIVEAGQVIGRQGGTGRVQSYDGTIASIDFLAPAPKAYVRAIEFHMQTGQQLRERIAQQLRNSK